MGSFYAASLPAELLLDVSFSDALSASFDEASGTYTLDGTQRLPQPKRLEPIADFINRADSAFPNSIILAANYRNEDGLLEEGPEGGDSDRGADRRWTIDSQADPSGQGEILYLTIPTPEKLAAIIDGQHRLFAFTKALADRRGMNLLCSVFLDLPKPYQAQLFATINSTQKPVDKSLTFELFGYNISEETSDRWSPDKLSVFLARKLATEQESPLRGRIIIAPRRDKMLESIVDNKKWKVSTAVIVEGIMRLFTSNPKKDSNYLMTTDGHQRTSLRAARKDRTPLRELYIEGNDAVIYEIVKNYLVACEEIFWSKAPSSSFITRTVGVQALFDVLRNHIGEIIANKDIRTERFANFLRPASTIDFSAQDFHNASGSGRTAIRNAIEDAIAA
jgi:DNA phosphorothioation-associated DGQHR protein 1